MRWGWPVGGQCGWSGMTLGKSERRLNGQGPGHLGQWGAMEEFGTE